MTVLDIDEDGNITLDEAILRHLNIGPGDDLVYELVTGQIAVLQRPPQPVEANEPEVEMPKTTL